MRTQLLDDRSSDEAWLERDPGDGQPVCRTPLEQFPFHIGRGATNDLVIDSSRVSREHAVIERVEHGYRVRDLRSTNGTLLNGQPVDEADLAAGDVLTFADTEFTFQCARAEDPHSTVTQTIPCNRPASAPAGWDIVRAVRRLNERALTRGVSTELQPIVALANHDLHGLAMATWQEGRNNRFDRLEIELLQSASRVASRARNVARWLAVEEALAVGASVRAFLKADAHEAVEDGFLDSLEAIVDATGASGRVVLEVNDAEVSDLPAWRSCLDRLEAMGVQVAYGQFAGGTARLAEHRQIAPAYLILARSFTEGLGQDRQRLEKGRKLIASAVHLGCAVIASGVDRRRQAQACLEAGCTYARGSLFSRSAVEVGVARDSEAALVV